MRSSHWKAPKMAVALPLRYMEQARKRPAPGAEG